MRIASGMAACALSGARQTPGVQFSRTLDSMTAGQGVGALLTRAAARPGLPPPVTAAAGAGAGATADALRPRPFERGFPGVADIEIVGTEEAARLLWDRGHAELVDRATADVIAEARDPEEVGRAVRKWRAVQPLLRWTPERPLAFRVEPGDGRHHLGERLWITITQPAPEFRFLTIVNLASTREVQFVFPAPGHVRSDQDRFAPGETMRRLGPTLVTVPTGADHVLALASTDRLDELHAALADLDNSVAPERLLDLLEDHAGDAAEVRVGLLPLFTAR
jgi:hypothetical protein